MPLPSLPPLPLPRFRFRFHKNVVILLVAIPSTNVEAADSANRFRFRIPGCNRNLKKKTLTKTYEKLHSLCVYSSNFDSRFSTFWSTVPTMTKLKLWRKSAAKYSRSRSTSSPQTSWKNASPMPPGWIRPVLLKR